MVQKCWINVLKVEKKFLYIVLFCKVKLSKMVSIKRNKIKNRQHFSSPTFHYKQLCFWFHEDSSTLKVFKMYFVLFSRPIQNVARRQAQHLQHLVKMYALGFKGKMIKYLICLENKSLAQLVFSMTCARSKKSFFICDNIYWQKLMIT